MRSVAAAFAVIFPLSAAHAGSPMQTVIYRFGDTAMGVRPASGMIMDAAGKLYGTLYKGEAGVNGGVFELSPPADGTRHWIARTLYRFNRDHGEKYPVSAVLTMDAAGNLYGTTPQGGSNDAGAAYELIKPAGQAQWMEKTLYRFDGGTSGGTPYGGMVFGPGGNLYGTTGFGGAKGAGTVFMLARDPKKPSGWAETVLYSFTNGPDGGYPYSLPVFDAAGNLYGTTETGGATGNGAVFRLSPPGGKGVWTETVLHDFGTGEDGSTPRIALTFDARGNLYGTTAAGGRPKCGRGVRIEPARGWRRGLDGGDPA